MIRTALRAGVMLGVFLVPMGAVFFVQIPALFAQSMHVPCHLLSSPQSVPEGFGAPYRITGNTRELLLSVSCGADEAIVSVGTGAQSEYVYEKAYAWSGTGWSEARLSGNTPAGVWFVGKATASLAKSTQELSERNFFVAYVCTWVSEGGGGSWKCGCRDAACAQPHWQLQMYQRTAQVPHTTTGNTTGNTSGGTTGSTTQQPAALTFYTADMHVHANGCGNLVLNGQSLAQKMRERNLNVSSVLIWGFSHAKDADNFRGQSDDPASENDRIMRWGYEISRLPGWEHGHLIMLNLKEKAVAASGSVSYPGTNYLLPNFAWAHAQGGIVGFAHGNEWGGKNSAVSVYAPVPVTQQQAPFVEWPLDVALAELDFLSDEVLGEKFLWVWYEMLGSGFNVPPLGGSDARCIPQDIAAVHTLFGIPEGEKLSYDAFIESVKAGRTVIRKWKSEPDFLHLKAQGTQQAVHMGGTLSLAKGAREVTAVVEASSAQNNTLELVVNGRVVKTAALSREKKSYSFTLPLSQSSWIAARTKDAHTAAVFIELGNCPVRTNPEGARKWLSYLDAYHQHGISRNLFGAKAGEVAGKIAEAKVVWQRIAEEGERARACVE